jgi:oligopeptide transport system substrate-binding protein
MFGRATHRSRSFVVAAIAMVLWWVGVVSALGAERILHRVGTDDPATVDPQRVSLPGEQLILLDLFMSLTTPGMDGRPMPGSAESWTVSPDGKVYLFTLRPNLRWSDGKAMPAADWVWAFQRMLDPKTAYPLASRLFPIKNARAISLGAQPATTLGVFAVDTRTLRIELENPTPYFTDIIMTAAMPAPRHVIEKYGTAWTRPENFVGNGPFVLDEWRPNGYVRVRRNANFWAASRVALDAVYHYPLGNPVTTARRFDAGELDLVLVVPPEKIDEIRKRNPRVAFIGRGLGNEVIVFNTRSGPTADRRVRRALSMLIERDVVARNVIGFPGVGAYSLVAPGVLNYDESAKLDFAAWSSSKRIAEAKRLLAEAGYGPGNPLRMRLGFPNTDLNRKVSVAVGAMWGQAGVKVELQQKEAKALVSEVGVGDFDAARFVWVASASDPYAYLERLLSAGSAVGMNTSGYRNPVFDAKLAEGSREADVKRRAAILREAEAIALADQPVAPVYFLVGRRLVAERVRGFSDNPRGLYPSWLLRVTP